MLFHPVTGLVRTTGLLACQQSDLHFAKVIHSLRSLEVKPLVLRRATILADQINAMLSNYSQEFWLQECQKVLDG